MTFRTRDIPYHLLASAGIAKPPPAKRPPIIIGGREFPPHMNKWEQQYARKLEFAVAAGEMIQGWWYEPLSFSLERLAVRCCDKKVSDHLPHSVAVVGSLRKGEAYYTPDFWTWRPFMVEAVEVKGHCREAALVRFKVAAAMYPWARWIMVRPSARHGWVTIRDSRE